MKIVLKALNSETLAYFEEALKEISDTNLIKSTKGMKDLLHGLKQNKSNPELLKQRIFANLKKNNFTVPILGILKSATLSDSFVSVLSEKALTDGMSALSGQLCSAVCLKLSSLNYRRICPDYWVHFSVKAFF